jgi:hypothetical protein
MTTHKHGHPTILYIVILHAQKAKTTRPTANNENKNAEIEACFKRVQHHPVGQAARMIQIMN